MADTKIEWTDKTWNPITGCTRISEGCQNCYAERMSKRIAGRFGYPLDDPFQVVFHPDRLEEPLKWRKPSRIFVCSMGDLFHENVPDRFISKIWDIMWRAHHHTFLVLTKRPERMKKWVEGSAYKKKFAWAPEEKAPFVPGDLIHLDDLWMRDMCGWTHSDKCECNGGYICGYPPDDEADTCEHGNRLCMSYNCPIACGDPSAKKLKDNDLEGQYEIDDEGNSVDCDWMEIFERPKNAFASNVWLGVTAENQQRADERIPLLLQTPAAKRFVSVEPMLEPVDIVKYIGGNTYRCGCGFHDTENELTMVGATDKNRYAICRECGKRCEILPAIDWIICGGETGPGARPMHPDWVRSLRDQSQAAGVPFFFKSWGDWFPRDQWEYNPDLILPDDDEAYINSANNSANTHVFNCTTGVYPVHRVGKKAAGRLLDGREWNEWPGVKP